MRHITLLNTWCVAQDEDGFPTNNVENDRSGGRRFSAVEGAHEDGILVGYFTERI